MSWADEFERMTQAQAEFVRRLRCDEGATWRGVAGACAAAWDGDWDQNQIAGMEICEQAAKMFGEDYFVEPWN